MRKDRSGFAGYRPGCRLRVCAAASIASALILIAGFSSYAGVVINNNVAGSYGPGTGRYVNSYTVINPFTGYYYSSGGSGSNGYSTTGPTVSTSTSTVTGSGWIAESNGKYRYMYSNGTYPSGIWDYIDGYWYYFDSDGYMHTGWLSYNGYWYYCLNSGRMATASWNNINDKWYYFNEAGIMQTGYIILDGKTYYTDSTGARVESAYNPDGHLFDLNGVMVE